MSLDRVTRENVGVVVLSIGAIIGAVTYNPATDTASVALDNENASFEALLSRLSVSHRTSPMRGTRMMITRANITLVALSVAALIGSGVFMLYPGVSHASVMWPLVGRWAYIWNAAFLIGGSLILGSTLLRGWRHDVVASVGTAFLAQGFIVYGIVIAYQRGWTGWTPTWILIGTGVALWLRVLVFGFRSPL